MRPEELIELYRLIAQLRERKAKLERRCEVAERMVQALAAILEHHSPVTRQAARAVLAEWEALK
jgi:hypothetical protein